MNKPPNPFKAIVIVGGHGTRVSELTGGITPKSLIRLSKKLPRPLCAYQLDQIKKAGVSDVLLITNYSWQEPIFRHSIRNGELPSMNYSFMLSGHDHPFIVFRDKQVLDFIRNSDFLFSNGDIFYSSGTVRAMAGLARKNSTSVGSGMYSRSARWRKDRKFLTFSKTEKGLLIDSAYQEKGDFTVHAPFFFKKEALPIIKAEALRRAPRTIHLLRLMIEKRCLSVHMPKTLVNLTTLADARKVERLLEEYY